MTMRAWRVAEWGGPESMCLQQITAPEPGPGEAVVRVRYAALNFFDGLMISGKYQVKPPFPFTPGCEIAGEVVAVGEGVEIKVGDRVCGQPDWGAFADQCVMQAHALSPVPNKVDLKDAACVPVVYPTGHISLRRRANLQAGETLLVTAAAGGVGIAAIQLGKAWGAKVIALAGGAEKCAVAKAEGADHALDYTSGEDWVEAVREITGGQGVDVVYDPVGGEIFDKALKVIAFEGRAIIIGFAGGEIQKIAANRLLLKNASAVGAIWGRYRSGNPGYAAEVMADCFQLMAAGKIKPAISATYSLEQAPEAIAALDSRKTWGKLVIDMAL
jgi:NADPH2:quinone reductase